MARELWTLTMGKRFAKMDRTCEQIAGLAALSEHARAVRMVKAEIKRVTLDQHVYLAVERGLILEVLEMLLTKLTRGRKLFKGALLKISCDGLCRFQSQGVVYGKAISGRMVMLKFAGSEGLVMGPEECPLCGSDEIHRVHHAATFALPECWVMECGACGYQGDPE